LLKIKLIKKILILEKNQIYAKNHSGNIDETLNYYADEEEPNNKKIAD